MWITGIRGGPLPAGHQEMLGKLSPGYTAAGQPGTSLEFVRGIQNCGEKSILMCNTIKFNFLYSKFYQHSYEKHGQMFSIVHSFRLTVFVFLTKVLERSKHLNNELYSAS